MVGFKLACLSAVPTCSFVSLFLYICFLSVYLLGFQLLLIIPRSCDGLVFAFAMIHKTQVLATRYMRYARTGLESRLMHQVRSLKRVGVDDRVAPSLLTDA